MKEVRMNQPRNRGRQRGRGQAIIWPIFEFFFVREQNNRFDIETVVQFLTGDRNQPNPRLNLHLMEVRVDSGPPIFPQMFPITTDGDGKVVFPIEGLSRGRHRLEVIYNEGRSRERKRFSTSFSIGEATGFSSSVHQVGKKLFCHLCCEDSIGQPVAGQIRMALDQKYTVSGDLSDDTADQLVKEFDIPNRECVFEIELENTPATGKIFALNGRGIESVDITSEAREPEEVPVKIHQPIRWYYYREGGEIVLLVPITLLNEKGKPIDGKGIISADKKIQIAENSVANDDFEPLPAADRKKVSFPKSGKQLSVKFEGFACDLFVDLAGAAETFKIELFKEGR